MPRRPNIVQAEIKLNAGRVGYQMGFARDTRLVGTWTHSLTNPVPISGQGECFPGARRNAKWGITTNGHLRAKAGYPAT